MKKIFALLVLVAIFSCEKDDDGLKYGNIIGHYTLTEATFYWAEVAPGIHIPHVEDLMVGCSDLTTIEIKANGTFEHVSFESEGCVDKKVRTGTWIVKSSFYGDPVGELKFDDSPNIYIMSGNDFMDKPGGDVEELQLDFDDDETVVPGKKDFSYDYTYTRTSALAW